MVQLTNTPVAVRSVCNKTPLTKYTFNIPGFSWSAGDKHLPAATWSKGTNSDTKTTSCSIIPQSGKIRRMITSYTGALTIWGDSFTVKAEKVGFLHEQTTISNLLKDFLKHFLSKGKRSVIRFSAYKMNAFWSIWKKSTILWRWNSYDSFS